MTSPKPIPIRRGDKFNLTGDTRRLLTTFLAIPDVPASKLSFLENEGSPMNNTEAIDQLETLITTYKKIFKGCHAALEENVPQVQRDALRESIKEFLDPGHVSESPTSNNNTMNQLNNLNDTFKGLFQKCYDALSIDATKSKRDEFRYAIAKFLDME